MRGDVGSTLTDQQKREVLQTARDVYRDSGVKKVLKGLDSHDEEIWGWPYEPDLFVKSDLTGRPCRFYITLPDGKIAHPSELFPEKTRAQWDSDLDREMARQRHEHRIQQDTQKSREARIVAREQWVNGSEDPAIDLGVRENPRQLRNWFLQQAWRTTGRGAHGHVPELWIRQGDEATVFVDTNDPDDLAFFKAQGFAKPVSESVLSEKDISIQDLRKATDPLFLRNKERSKDVHLRIAEITPTGTIVTLSNSVTLKKENHWRQSIKLLDWDEALAADDLSFPDRANLAVFGRLQVKCSCPAYLYWGYEYIETQLGSDNIEVPDYEGKTGGEKRYPKVRNPKLRGVICKHLTAVLLTLERSIPEVASAMASYARLGKIKVGSGKVQNAE